MTIERRIEKAWTVLPGRFELEQAWASFQTNDMRAKLILEVEHDNHVGEWFWHVRNDVLAEPLTQPHDTILNKLKESPNSDIRLKWFTRVKGPLPEDFSQVWDIVHFELDTPAYTFRSSKPWANLFNYTLNLLHMREHGSECPWNGKTLTRE